MKFEANADKAEKCFVKNNWHSFFALVFFGIFCFIRVGYSFHTYRTPIFSTLYAAFALFLFFVMVVAAFQSAKSMNLTVNVIEPEHDVINVETLASHMFFGLVKRASRVVAMPRSLILFEMSDNKYGFDKELTSEIYHLWYEGDKYLIMSGFFMHFGELKRDLESNQDLKSD